MTEPSMRFPFAFDPRYRRILSLLAITPSRSWVSLDRGWMEARFGPWRLRTPVANIEDTQVTGPYRAHRAIGPHISLVDRGLSFGSNTERGLCMRFSEPVPGRETLGVVHHPGLTVTVADVEALIAAIDRGLDARRSDGADGPA